MNLIRSLLDVLFVTGGVTQLTFIPARCIAITRLMNPLSFGDCPQTSKVFLVSSFITCQLLLYIRLNWRVMEAESTEIANQKPYYARMIQPEDGWHIFVTPACKVFFTWKQSPKSFCWQLSALPQIQPMRSRKKNALTKLLRLKLTMARRQASRITNQKRQRWAKPTEASRWSELAQKLEIARNIPKATYNQVKF